MEAAASQTVGSKKKRVTKKHTGGSMKRGCQCYFVAKQPYLDNTLCEIQYHNMDHHNMQGESCHGEDFSGSCHSLGNRLSDGMKQHLMSLLRLGLSPAQVLAQHKARIKELAFTNADVDRDTFVLPSDVRNLSNKRAEELWQKHPKDSTSVRMWMQENMDSVFFYQEYHSPSQNLDSQTELPFTIGIQTEWQLEMMLKFGHHRAVSCDATFGTNEKKVSH